MRQYSGWAVLVVTLLLALIPFLHKGTKGVSELPVYTLAGERMLAGDEIYRPSEGKPFTYPPFFALPFTVSPAIPMDPPRATLPIIGWYAINAVALAFILVMVHRLILGTPGSHPIREQGSAITPREFSPWLFWFVTLVLSGRYLWSVLGNQSHDLLVFLPLVLAVTLLVQKRDATASLWLAVAAAFKATPLLFLGLLIVQRRFQALLFFVIALIVVTLLPDLFFPRQDGNLWVVAWLQAFVFKVDIAGPAATGPWVADNILNQNLSGTLLRISQVMGIDPTVTKLITIFTQLATLGLVTLALLRKREDSTHIIWQCAAVFCGMLLLSPMSSKAHFCILLLPIAALVREALTTRHPIDTATIVFTFLLGTVTSKDIVGRELGHQILGFGTVTWITLTLLIVATYFSQTEGSRQKP